MRKIVYILALCTFLVSCELETSGNKELDGYWQMCQVDTLATDGVTDTREALIYWGGLVVQVRKGTLYFELIVSNTPPSL